MNTEQLKTDRTAIEILRFRMVERLRIDQPSWTEELCSKKVNDFLDEEDPNFGECFTTAMQDFASQESKRAVEKDRESRWISVKERLPEEEVEVLCFGFTGSMMVGAIWAENEKDGYYAESTDGMLDDVTHWQQLPEPPKL